MVEGANGRQARKRLREPGEDRWPGDRIDSLELTRSSKIISINISSHQHVKGKYSSLHDTQIEPSKREKGKQKWREAGTNDEDDEQANGEGSTKALDHTSENLVDDIGIAREQVQNPT